MKAIRTTDKTTRKTTRPADEQAARGQARQSLEDSLALVSQIVERMPLAEDGNTVSDAFMRTDPVLTMLDRSILAARANLARMIALFGRADAMAEALETQISALERAYAERLAMLKRKREESTRKDLATHKLWAKEERKRDVRTQPRAERRRNNGALWLWAFLILRDRMTDAPRSGHVPKAA
ncbi:MAG: hypothetical protein H6865_01170 [Rhodospirillales bacterium]|nr:hypothetical protein [Alphaproteobacteria bacterium]MCB9986237.1 hypothetical protein [Rhodospirillales bacterium]USO07208.1 MAG: hypothetical protein H6866_07200 [Rhodospirillales bacterium]